jgi:GAF domain-containing protein
LAEQQIQYSADKATAYGELVTEISGVVAGETSRTARYATTISLLKAAFGERFFWCGFYEVDPGKSRELVIGPYQGTLGCLRIPFDKGVCGACASTRETIIVPDVHAFPGHIACDAASNSEIVVPLIRAAGPRAGELIGVLDLDSPVLGRFDAVDQAGLEKIAATLLASLI